MRMDRGLDTGPVLATESTHIDPDETGATLTARLATMGSELLCRCLPQLDQLMSTPQDDSTATIAPKLRPSIAAINWNNPATVIHNQVRALAGRQTAWSTLRHRNQSVLVKVHAGESLSGKSANQPGSIVQHNRQDIIVVQTGEGLYGIRLLQLAAGKGTIQAAAAARNGFVFLAEQAGAVFEFST
jgi:methionyl-tRNA formyltransferase